MKLIVVTLTTSQFITMTHSRANRVFSLYWLDCFDSVDGDLNEGGVFSWRKKIGPSLSLCPSPSLSPQLRHREGPVFSRCAFGSDLITYLFGLSYSKLHWLCVLLRAEAFSPSRPPPSAFHPASWPLTAVTARASRWVELCFQPAPLLLTIPLTHAPLTSSLAGHIASAACNSLQRGLMCPPPIVTCYKSVRGASGSKRQPRFTSTPAAVLKLNSICQDKHRPTIADSYNISTTRCSQWKAFIYSPQSKKCSTFVCGFFWLFFVFKYPRQAERAGGTMVWNNTRPSPARFNILQSGCQSFQKNSKHAKANGVNHTLWKVDMEGCRSYFGVVAPQ